MNNKASSKEVVDRFPIDPQGSAAAIYERFYPRLLQAAEGMIGANLARIMSAEDAVQTAFRTFLRNALAGRYSVDHTTALSRLLTTILLNKIRKAAGREKLQSLPLPDFPDPGPNSEEVTEAIDDLVQTIDGLPYGCTDVMLLALQGYREWEIAEQLFVSRWTVRRRLDRILERWDWRHRG